MTTTALSHKQLAVNCFNMVWDLLDLAERTKEEEEKMIHLAHSSLWHWSQVEDHTAKNLSIGYWQLSRVYSTVRLGERAVYYGNRCLEVSLEHNIEPFYIGYAYEALCRAYALLGQTDASKKAYSTALEYVQQIVDENSKEMLVKDLQTIK